jgi:hypothetical protein
MPSKRTIDLWPSGGDSEAEKAPLFTQQAAQHDIIHRRWGRRTFRPLPIIQASSQYEDTHEQEIFKRRLFTSRINNGLDHNTLTRAKLAVPRNVRFTAAMNNRADSARNSSTISTCAEWILKAPKA